ncbi:MAG TPA: hypothetical protein VEA78_11965 [Acidimicrobiales bacterium]|nr:hypothetical protein [Acidimicrobiales bacterium]
MAPLNVLLSHAVLEITREAERLLPGVNAVQWSDFWRVADGASLKSLHLDARISKRVVKTYVGGAEKQGLITVDDGKIALTEDGERRRDDWGHAVTDASAGAEVRWGDDLRRALEPLVGALDHELPHYLHPYGTPDPTITGGHPHGADWKFVDRSDPQSARGLPLLALLSQALVAFTIEYEAREAGPLLWAINVQSAFDGGSMPLADVPKVLDVRGDGKSGTERHGVIAVRNKVATLTPIGQGMKDAYAAIVADIESAWTARHGSALRDALEPVDAELPTPHADHPIVVFAPGTGGFVEVSATL